MSKVKQKPIIKPSSYLIKPLNPFYSGVERDQAITQLAGIVSLKTHDFKRLKTEWRKNARSEATAEALSDTLQHCLDADVLITELIKDYHNNPDRAHDPIKEHSLVQTYHKTQDIIQWIQLELGDLCQKQLDETAVNSQLLMQYYHQHTNKNHAPHKTRLLHTLLGMDLVKNTYARTIGFISDLAKVKSLTTHIATHAFKSLSALKGPIILAVNALQLIPDCYALIKQAITNKKIKKNQRSPSELNASPHSDHPVGVKTAKAMWRAKGRWKKIITQGLSSIAVITALAIGTSLPLAALIISAGITLLSSTINLIKYNHQKQKNRGLLNRYNDNIAALNRSIDLAPKQQENKIKRLTALRRDLKKEIEKQDLAHAKALLKTAAVTSLMGLLIVGISTGCPPAIIIASIGLAIVALAGIIKTYSNAIKQRQKEKEKNKQYLNTPPLKTTEDDPHQANQLLNSQQSIRDTSDTIASLSRQAQQFSRHAVKTEHRSWKDAHPKDKQTLKHLAQLKETPSLSITASPYSNANSMTLNKPLRNTFEIDKNKQITTDNNRFDQHADCGGLQHNKTIRPHTPSSVKPLAQAFNALSYSGINSPYQHHSEKTLTHTTITCQEQ